MLWLGSPNHTTFVSWSLEQWGFRLGKGSETPTPALLPLKDFLSYVTPGGDIKKPPDASAPHTLVQYLADFSRVWALPASSPLALAAGVESVLRCLSCLSVSASVPWGPDFL